MAEEQGGTNHQETHHLPQAYTATRPSSPAPRRAGLTRVPETSSFGLSPGGRRGPLTTKKPDFRKRCWLRVHPPVAPPVESSVCGSHAGLTPARAMCERPRGRLPPVRQGKQRGHRPQRDPGRSTGRGPEARLTMVPTNSAHTIIPREQRREDGRRKEGGSDDTRYHRGRGRARGFPPAPPPASRGTGLGRKRRSPWRGRGLVLRHAHFTTLGCRRG